MEIQYHSEQSPDPDEEIHDEEMDSDLNIENDDEIEMDEDYKNHSVSDISHSHREQSAKGEGKEKNIYEILERKDRQLMEQKLEKDPRRKEVIEEASKFLGCIKFFNPQIEAG